MKAKNDCTGSRRPRRNATPRIGYAAAIVFFCIVQQCDDVRCRLRGAAAFQYDDRKSTSCRLHSSIARIRGGGDEPNRIDLQVPSDMPSLVQAPAVTTTDGPPDHSTIIGPRPLSKGLWKRIRTIRGGVEGGKGDDIDESERDEETKSTTGLEDEFSEASAKSKGVDSETSPGSSSDETQLDEVGDDETCETNKGKEDTGVFASFFSFFRGPAQSDASSERAVTNITGIAHKMPHGPDGRGGGSAMYATVPPKPAESAETKEKEPEDREGEDFVITTEVAEAAPAASPKLAEAEEAESESGSKLPIGVGGNSTAFVVPPPHIKSKEAKKKRKQQKSNAAVVDDVKAIETPLNQTLNATSFDVASNITATVNVTESDSLVNESDVEVTFDGGDSSQPQDYTSSGYWVGIDLVASLGLSSLHEDLKISRALRPVRKAAAKATGLHGFISGKEYNTNDEVPMENTKASTVISIDEELGIHDANALEAEMLARRVASRKKHTRHRGNNRAGRRWGLRRGQQRPADNNALRSDYVIVQALDSSPDALEHRRRKRVEEIDRLLQRGSERLSELQNERDDLLRAPNPLFNYTKKFDPSTNHTFGDVRTTREFNFPNPELVDEYIGELVSHGRLIRLNHTDLWQSRSDYGPDDDEDEIVDLLTPGADARKLYEDLDQMNKSGNRKKSGGGSWLLRTGFGMSGGSLGEKLGETIEIAAYKGVCSAVMMVFARMLSGLHGVNILSHSDIRLYIEQDPDLPPVAKKYGHFSGDDSNYAQEAIKTAIQKGARKKRKTSKSGSSHRSRRHGHELSEDAFIQRDFVVETLISHCQISAPLLKLFPLDWQRAMVGNIITLATAIISDFADGLKVQILGHALTVSFKPITEADLIQHIGVGGFRQNHRRTRPDEFEAAVLATAQDMSDALSFLDGWLEWFERRVGGGVLRSQIGHLIARVVLTLVDEVLSAAQLDLWSSQANGPRLYAALEYRTSKTEEVSE